MAIKLLVRDLDNPEKCRVDGVGFDLKIVGDQDANQFGLPCHTGYHDPAWIGVRNLLGRLPNEMHLCEKTGGQFMGYAFSSNGKDPCQVRRTFKSAKILSLSTKPEVLDSVRHDNTDNSDEGEFTANLGRTVEDTIEKSTSTSLSLGYSLTVGVEVGSEASGVKAKVESTYSFEASYEKSQSRSYSKSFTSEIGTQVKVPPHKCKRSVLYAAHGQAEFEVEYEYELFGEVYLYYKKSLHNVGHHAFVNVKDLLKVMGREDRVIGKELVSIGIYGDSYSKIEDVHV